MRLHPVTLTRALHWSHSEMESVSCVFFLLIYEIVLPGCSHMEALSLGEHYMAIFWRVQILNLMLPLQVPWYTCIWNVDVSRMPSWCLNLLLRKIALCGAMDSDLFSSWVGQEWCCLVQRKGNLETFLRIWTRMAFPLDCTSEDLAKKGCDYLNSWSSHIFLLIWEITRAWHSLDFLLRN